METSPQAVIKGSHNDPAYNHIISIEYGTIGNDHTNDTTRILPENRHFETDPFSS
jgi:hypothetical protein